MKMINTDGGQETHLESYANEPVGHEMEIELPIHIIIPERRVRTNYGYSGFMDQKWNP